MIQLGKEKQAILLVFPTVSEAARCYAFLKKAQENQRETYKMRKYDIKINLDFCIHYSNKLSSLEEDFRRIVESLYSKASQLTPKDTAANQMRKFSMLFNSYMVGFNAKTTLEPRYMALFLKIFQNFFFDRVIEKVIKNKMKKAEVVLELINDMKFHEEYLNKWKIGDLRIIMSIKSLENIYMKLYFNANCVEIVSIFEKLKLPTYYYYIGDKKISYLIADGFNTLKGQLLSIKNIRKDMEFKVNVLTYLKRGVLLFLLNLEFFSTDTEVKLDVEKFPPLVNSFSEIWPKFEQMLKTISDGFKIGHKYLFYFFPRNHYRAWFNRISDNINRLYQYLLTQKINNFFKNLKSIDGLIISDYFADYITSQLDLASQFLPQYNTLVESALMDATLNGLLEFVADNFQNYKDFEYDVFKIKLAEMQSKIINLKTNDSLTKLRAMKTIRSFTDFFSSNQNMDYNIYNISFGFSFRKNYEKMNKIICLRPFQNEQLRQKMIKNLQNSTEMFNAFNTDYYQKNRLYFKVRILKFINKFACKLKQKYDTLHGEPGKTNDGASVSAAPQNDQEPEPPKKPADVEDVKLSCRYFCYKKPSKQNYAYIKYK